jgi:monoamine oxidase
VLKTIPADFSPEFAKAIGGVAYNASGKVGLQFNRRFWEEDDEIFGGSSALNQTISTIVYPSFGYLGAKGVVIGSYTSGPNAELMSNLSPADRVARALAEGAKLHPQYRQHFETGFSLYWNKSPYNLGGWAQWTPETRKTLYPLLNQPDGPIYLAGEHLSYVGGWMSGAFQSGRAVATAVHTRLMQTTSYALNGAE